MFIAGAILLSSCSGALGASSWPGISADEENAYVAYNAAVYSLRLKDGNLNWQFPGKAESGRSFYAAPELIDGKIIVGDYKNTLHLLDAQSGISQWEFTGAKGRWIAGAKVKDDLIFAPNGDNNLYALDINGNVKWKFETQQALWSNPLSDDELIFQASMDHYLYAINLSNGVKKWSVDLGGAVVYAPVMGDNGVIYVSTLANEILAVDSKSGNILWRVVTENGLWSQPEAHNGVVYYGDQLGIYYALSAEDGSKIWDYKSGEDPIMGGSTIIPDGVVFTTENGKVVALSFEGELLWTKQVNGKLYASPVVAGESLILGISQGENIATAFDFSGNVIWNFAAPK